MAIRINGTNYDTTIHKGGRGLGSAQSTTADFNSTESLGTYHMAENANLYEIQRSNNFEFVVYFTQGDLVKARNFGDNTTTSVNDSEAQEVIRMSVSQVAIPHFSQDPIEIKRGNSSLKYAGTPRFTDGSLTLNDYIGADTKAMLMAWQNQSYDVITEKVGLASDYKKKASLIEYSPDLQPIRTWTLYGCWISSMSEPDYSSDDNGKHTISVTISYDKATLDDGVL